MVALFASPLLTLDDRALLHAGCTTATLVKVAVMGPEEEVLAAARDRGQALGRGDEQALRALLHPQFLWTSHRGETFSRESYLRSNVGGRNTWFGQELVDTVVVVEGDLAVLRCVVVDDVDIGAGRQLFRMPVTQTWVRGSAGWVCLAGHAGPREN